METVILEKTIIKLGSLLALGFGEAGANIISKNMSGAAQTTAGVNAMLPGERVECIIGFARIRNFSTATEVLQSKIMTFANRVAEIVHGVVSEFHGHCNKNNGDTFLIIWRIDDLPNPIEDTTRMAEMSIVSLAKILCAVHRSPVLAAYREHPGLQMRLRSNTRVHLTFSLHSAWAIEGAVGSDFKIDASYLSPHVSIAKSIESVSEVYRVPILIAESVQELCSPKMAAKCRLIDKVLVTGSAKPFSLFSVDLDYMALDIADLQPLTIQWPHPKRRFEARRWLAQEKEQKMTSAFDPASVFDTDPHITLMRQVYTLEFMHLYNMGYQNYFLGEWGVARRILEKTLKTLPFKDGPTLALLSYMELHSVSLWKGVRVLSALDVETHAH